jgi:hypothetical protein
MRSVCVVAVLVATAGLTSCGGIASRDGAGDATVLRVGDHSVSRAEVDHWIGLIKRGEAFGGARGAPQGTLEERALALLISSEWLTGEAERQGIVISPRAVEQAIVKRDQAARFRRTDQSTSSLEFEARAELAADALREKLTRQAGRVTPSEIVSFYRRNQQLFSGPEVRLTDLIESQPDPETAEALVHKLGTGRRFAEMAIHERVTHTRDFMLTAEKVRLVDAIFAARPGVASRPFLIYGGWLVFVVRRVIPARKLAPLAAIRNEVIRRLIASRSHTILSAFDRGFEARWRARTSCKGGYLGPGCPQSAIPLGQYEDPFLTGSA